MRYRFLLVPSVVFSLFLSSCKESTVRGAGPQGTEVRSVAAFNAVAISLPVDAEITVQEGATPSVQLSGYQNLLSHIKTQAQGNTLVIDNEDGWDISTDKNIKAQITVASLAGIDISGEGQMNIHGNVTGQALKIDISGDGNVAVDNLNVNKVSGDISGSGNIDIKAGGVRQAAYDISGSGTVKAYPLQSIETVASISGSGNADVTVQQKLAVHISGSGNVHYKGHPVVTSDISGGGKVSDAN